MVTVTQPSGTPAELEAVGYDDCTWDKPWNLPRGQLTCSERMPTAALEPGRAIPWTVGPPLALGGLVAEDPLTGRQFSLEGLLQDRMRADGLLVVHRGRLIAEWYGNGMTDHDLHVVHSCSKTLTSMAIGIAISEQKLDPTQLMSTYVNELASMPAWNDVTLQNVLDMATGIATDEHYEDPTSMYWRYADAVGYYGFTSAEQAIGCLAFVSTELTTRACASGEVFNYASYLTNLLPIALERAYGIPACEFYETRIYQHIGAESQALINVDSLGAPIVEGQVNLTLRDFARWAYLLVNDGKSLDGTAVIPREWQVEAFRTSAARRRAFERSDYADAMPGGEYHNQAWLLNSKESILAMLGIHGQYAYIDLPRELMIVGLSSFPDQANPLMIATLQEIWTRITDAVA